ncbi:MAG: hypothetical protein WC780_01425 [Lentimicrobiaceae bacterium]|jgi:hypothetical protein
MKTQTLKFSNIIDSIYSLPLEDRLEIKNLLEHNIADERRNEIEINFKKSLVEENSGKLIFSSNITELKEIL